jgi:FkbM family methyltransferase
MMKYKDQNLAHLADIKKMINHELATYIYGAGITGSKVNAYLKNLGIKISGFIVDNKNIDSLHNLPIYGFNEIEHGPFNLVLGYVPTNETVDDIYSRVFAKNKSINFIAYDFSFLSFGLFNEDYLISKEFGWVKDNLEDKYSLETLIAYVKSRNSGDYRGSENYYEPNQYFPNDIISFQKNEIFVDCGVFDGETIKEFIFRNNNTFDYVYGFEPDKNNYEKSLNNLTGISFPNITLFNLGSWDKNDILKFNSISERVSEIDENGTEEIKVDSIDNLIKNKKVSFIKMDVEGAELNSLKGAEINIKVNRPKLAICLYHKPEDIYNIIYWINSLELNYKYYIRLHTRFSQELVLYCI